MLEIIETGRGLAPWLTKTTPAESTKAVLHFSPANGIPVGSYDEFLSHLEVNFDITGMDNRGAWPNSRLPKRGWTWLDHADDLIAGIEAQHLDPVVGVGHSIGGTITILAACKRPELFSKVVVIDAASVPSKTLSVLFPLIPEWLSFWLFKFIKGSHERQSVWDSPQIFFDHYRNHPTYKNFTELSMRNYAEHGLRERSDGQYELRFHPSWESYNFRSVYYLWSALTKIQQPTLLLRAENTYMYTQKQFDERNANLGQNVNPQTIPNSSHLAPLERPAALADQIINWLSSNRIKIV